MFSSRQVAFRTLFQCSMSFQFVDDHRAYIQRELKFRLQRRPLYSQRALARDLELSPSTLTDFLKGRLALSSGRIAQLSKKMGLTEEQKQHWIDLTTYKFSQNSIKKKESYIKIQSRIGTEKNAISLEEFKVVSEWQHFAFLELIEMNSKKYSNLKQAATALSISLPEMKESVRRLMELNLLRLGQEGHYVVDQSTHVGNGTPSEAIRSFHSQILKKATVAIDQQDITGRFNSSVFVGLPKAKVPMIIEQLKSLSHQFLEAHIGSEADVEKDSLYCLSLQFFNLTHPSKP